MKSFKEFILIFLIILKSQFLFSEEKKCNIICKSIIGLSFSFALDEKLREENLNFSNSFKERTIKIFEPLGRRSFGFYLSSVSLFLGFTKKDKNYNFLALELIEANLISDLSSNLLQKGFGRIRPQKSGGDSHLFFKGGNSFPSSHSIHSWAWASVLSFKYPKYKYYSFFTCFIVKSFGGQTLVIRCSLWEYCRLCNWKIYI